MTPDTSGPALPPPSAFYDPEACCWKTSGVMFPSDWPTSSQTCPAWGMTRRGELYALPTPALPTAEPASSSSPTRLFDTPDTMPEAPNTGSNRTDPSKPPGLWNQIQTVLLPTPVVNDMGEGKTPEDWDAWTHRMQEKHGNGNGHGASLSIEAQKLLPTPKTTDEHSASPADAARNSPGLRAISALLPTPTAMDSAGSRNSTQPRKPGSTANIGDTLTDAATILTGARTRARSDDGKPSSDDPLPGQLSLLPEATESGCPPPSSSG